MLKFAILLFNTLAVLMYQFLFSDGITVTQVVPTAGKTGKEFTIEITVNKGTSGGFAKLQETLPAGFTAIEDKNNGASFFFPTRVVTFIWMTLPNDKEFKISYKVKVAEGVSGDQSIDGKFAYVVDNVKQETKIEAATIAISAGDGGTEVASTTTEPKTTETATTDKTTETGTEVSTETSTTEPKITETATTKSSTGAAGSEASTVTCARKVPGTVSGEFTVELTINKGNLTGFAKLMEVLPTGFTASADESAGASFSYADQKVRFIWVSLPTQPEIKISYKVKIDPTVVEDQSIDGKFSYIENDETRFKEVPTSKVSIGSGGATQTVAKTTEPTNTQTSTQAKTTETPNYVTNGNTSTKEPKGKKTKTSSSSAQSFSATNIPSANVKLHYKVQVMALHKYKRSTDFIASLYKINETVNLENGEGFRKYTVGTHDEYKAARDARETFKSKGVVAPFVTAYNRGRRITVQEALMVSSQKWNR